MAKEKTEEQKFQVDSVTFEDNPLIFCQTIYAEALQRQEDLRETNKENRLLYEGIDTTLQDRENDPLVKRSALFIPEVTPAIDTRIGNGLARLEEKDRPVTATPRKQNPSEGEKEQAAQIEYELNLQLRESGYLSNGVREHWLGAEIYRSPSCVKIDWREEMVEMPEPVQPTLIDMATALIRGQAPKSKVKWVRKDVGGPSVEWLYPDEFLYEPNRSDYQRDSRYTIHAIWVDQHELMAMAEEQGWDVDEVRKFIAEVEGSTGPSSGEDAQRDEIEDEKETPFEKGFKDGKHLVAEFYVATFDLAGQEVVNKVVVVGDKKIVFEEVFKGLRGSRRQKFPFVPISINQLPGTIEGLSSIDRGKFLQKLNNEIFNSYLDAVSYRIFPPFKKEAGVTFNGTPVFAPAAIWEMSDIRGLEPVIQNMGDAPNLPPLMAAVSAKIRNVLDSPDIDQGFQSQQHEKATSTKLRAAGALRRSIPTHKVYGRAIIDVAEQFLALDRQHHEQAAMFALDVVIDVPSLTGASDPDSEKQEAMLLVQQAENSQLYQNSTGMVKIRNLTADMMQKFKKVDTDDYVPTEEELNQEMQKQAEQAVAMIDKESAGEQLAIEQAGAQAANEERENGVPVQQQ